ncbi:MAG TPA: GtrA family protein [Candidatus Norongarragalinales archaeon]|jgi:dolichol-phosphate mannosyltransferase|nr:GtrA family protein [Candidatus Norongarragalinales archaeon]
MNPEPSNTQAQTPSRLDYHYWLGHRKLQVFLLVGAVGSLVNLGLLYGLTEWFKLYYLFSGAIALEVSLLLNFVLHDNITWKNTTKTRTFKDRLFRYHVVSFGGMAINYAVLALLTEHFGLWYMASSAIGILVAAGWNYKVNSRLTFV